MGATFFFFFFQRRCEAFTSFGMLEMHCKPTKLIPFVGISACLQTCIVFMSASHESVIFDGESGWYEYDC